jgi:Kef-type K+ transport system membrane component KefB
MNTDIFVEISSLLVASAIISMLMRALKQPMIIAYIITGLIVGPSLLGIVHSAETMEVLANFGVALLLFIVGLGLNPRVIKEVGKVSLLAGAGQIAFTTIVGFVLVRGVGYNTVTALYISVAFAFSSTIIILKILSDKKEQSKLYGKIAAGLLLVQDVTASFALLLAAAAHGGSLRLDSLAWLALKGVFLVGGVVLFSQLVLKPMTNFFAKSQELLFLFAIAWGFGIATLFYRLGFSLEVGALLAGVCLAGMTYAQEVGSRLRPLRDFFIIVFFIALGSRINIHDVAPE